MALNRNDLLSLMKIVAKADPSAVTAYSFGEKQYSYDTLNETLRREMAEYAGTYAQYRENKNLIFALMETVLDDVLPKKVMEQYGAFAEVKTFAQGDKPVFTKRVGKNRAKQFITKVGLAGIYEVFKLSNKSFEVETSAFGGAAQIGLEEFLDGKVDFAELTTIVLEGLDEKVYEEIALALKKVIDEIQATNKHAHNGFNETKFDDLLNIASAYGQPVIYCTFEFATKMIPEKDWISEAMKNERWEKGYFANYKGRKVIILPQSYTDETNTTKVIDPGYCWILPSGDAKPVKIAFEGNTIVDEYVNADRSREIQAYKKFGVATLATNDMSVYIDTSLTFDENDGAVEY